MHRVHRSAWMRGPILWGWVGALLAAGFVGASSSPGPDPVDGPPESRLSAAEVKPGAVLLRREMSHPVTISGFYIRLDNAVGPTGVPVVAALRVGEQRYPARVSIPVFPWPLMDSTRTGGLVHPPLDVGREYRAACIPPLDVASGETVTIEVLSAGHMVSGVVAGLQFQGRWPLAGMRQPFRAARAGGPVSRVAWSEPEVVCTGNQEKNHPECAPQNNSGVVADEDGTCYQFTAFYSVDEQYGGGRGGSIARIFAFRRPPGTTAWEKMGLLVDPTPDGLSYAGDPYAFRDLDGTPCLAYTTVDGTHGFADWKRIDGRLLRSKTKSFAGPWETPHALFKQMPRGVSDDGRIICLRVYPRPETRDYVLVWQHGGRDIEVRGLVLANLQTTLTEEQLGRAVVLVRNQEEGGGGFQHRGRGYLSTWQIPCINDPTGLQRLYEFDLADALNPESWRVVPGSWGFNDGTRAVENGGTTADAWALSMVGSKLWSTQVAWSAAHQKNSILARRVSWDQRHGDTFRYGVPRVAQFREVTPVVEYALGHQCSLRLDFQGKGREAWAFFLLGPADRPSYSGAVGLEVSPRGTRLVAYSDQRQVTALTPYQAPEWEEGQVFHLKLQRDGDRLSARVNDHSIGPVTLSDPLHRQHLAEAQRFKLYGWQGGLYTIRHAVLTDGPE